MTTASRRSGSARPDLGPLGQRALIAGAATTVLTEIAHLFGWLPSITVGGYGLSPSLVPAALLIALLGRRLVGRAGDPYAEVVFWAAALLALLAVGITFVRIGEASTVLAVLGASVDEEVVYRLALPLVVTLALAGWGLRSDRARVGGFVVAGVCFALLPGHRAQMSHLGDALPFLAFAALASVVVYRSGSVLAVIAIHAATDLCNLLALQNRMGPDARVAILLALFVLLVLAYGKPARRRAEPVPPAGTDPPSHGAREPVIDLRDQAGDTPAGPPPAGDDDGEHLPVS